MISWMQKHNRYLVWTIWIATVAFIGAGFVGWGSYNFGSKAGNVAKVGTVEISQTRLNMVYSNLYNQYNQMLQGALDEKKAKEMGLVQQAFAQLEMQASILNLAEEFGIIVSDQELIEKLETIKAFQKEDQFSKEIYHTYLQSQRIKASVFESTLKDELMIQKVLSLFDTQALPFEEQAIAAGMNISDKLAYEVLTNSDLNLTIDPAELKKYWEKHQNNYMTKTMYTLSLLWTNSVPTVVTDEEVKAHYKTNSFNYTDATGKQLSFEEAKTLATRDLKLKKTKKTAQKAYIAFKKGQRKADEKVTLSLNDPQLSPDAWDAIKDKASGEIIKPKIVADKYVTIQIETIDMPHAKTFEEAREEVTADYTKVLQKEGLLKLAQEKLKNFDQNSAIISGYVKLTEDVSLQPLDNQESLQFLQKLFTSTKEKGMISLKDKVVVYNVIDQKIQQGDANQTRRVKQTTNKLKQSVFESNLIKLLLSKYPTEVYMGGLKN